MNATLLSHSLVLAGSTTAASVVAGWLVSLFAWSCGPRGRRCLLGAAILTLALPPFLVTNSWLDLIGQTGRWRSVAPFDLYSITGATWVLLWMHWPLTVLLTWGAWERLEPSWLEVEPRLRGWAFLRWMLWPLARPSLGAAVVLTLALTLNQFAVPAILQVKVLPAEMWVSYSTRLNAKEAFALSWPLLLVPVSLWWWLRGRAMAWPRWQGSVTAPLFRARLGRGWRGVSLVATLSVLVFSLVVPLGQLLGASRTWVELAPALAAGQRAVAQTLAGAAGTATLVAGAALSVWARPVGAIAWAFFFLPGVLLGIGMIVVANRPVFDVLLRTVGAVLIAWCLRYFAPAWSILAEGMRGRDQALLETARLHGVKGWAHWCLVSWPLLGSRVAAAWYVTYLLCLWDVETLVLLVPPGFETLALRVFNLLHYGHAGQVNALCLALLLLALAPLLLWRLGVALRHATAIAGRSWARAACVALAAGLLSTGCGKKQEGVTRLDSKLFSQVEIIGRRGTGPGEFNKPRSLALDRQDNLYVADMTGRVQKFSPEGVFIKSWEMPQTDLGKPKGMDCDGQGRIIVVEPHYMRVNHFDAEGRLQKQWGVNGTNAGQLAFPRAVAVTAQGDLWISEYSKVERAQKFSADGGKCLVVVGRPGDHDGEFARAEGIGVDRAGQLYVADSCNHRIQIFGADGHFVRSHGRAGAAPGQLSYPYDVRVDPQGRQYVCEFGNSRVQIFDATDQLIEVLGGPGGEPGQFSNPWALALDSKGNLYVADAVNHRVQKLVRRAGTWSGSQSSATAAHAPGGQG